jgi:predicted peptidase
MWKSSSLFAAAPLLMLTACGSFTLNEYHSGPGTQMIKPVRFKTTQTLNVNYLLFLPADYKARSDRTWPLLLFLHGSGERGGDLRLVAVHGPPKYVLEHPDFPFILVAPQCPQGQLWSQDTLLALLDEIVQKYRVDKSRIYLTGLSMGGYATWDLGLTHPEKFAAIAPVCGGAQMLALSLTSREKPQPLKTLPVWAFHGANDPVVLLEESQRMIDALKKIGNKNAQLTIYPDTGHNSWTKTYDNPQLYDWLLQHERKTNLR